MSDTSASSTVEVLLTGFGSFDEIEENPSSQIVQTLKGYAEEFNGREIRLAVYPEPIEVAYENVYTLVPKLREQYPQADYFIHLGVHQKAEKFRIERRARKGPYERKDVRGCSFSGPRDGDKTWNKLPQELFTNVDVPALVELVKADLQIDNLEASDDPGMFLCEFIFYNSLTQARVPNGVEDKAVESLFFHVPVCESPKHIQQGRDILLSIIRAIST